MLQGAALKRDCTVCSAVAVFLSDSFSTPSSCFTHFVSWLLDSFLHGHLTLSGIILLSYMALYGQLLSALCSLLLKLVPLLWWMS